MKPIVLSMVALLGVSLICNAQSRKHIMKLGDSVTTSFHTEDIHNYTLELKTGEVVYLKVEQQGQDVFIAAHDPDGKEFEVIDYSGRFGMEPILFSTDQSGHYSLKVKPFETDKKKGMYTISYLNNEPVATSPETRVDQLMLPFRTTRGPGAAIVVMKDGKISYMKNFGLANLEYDIPITSESVFHIASVSKQFTVMAALLLQEEGKLTFEDDIRKYIPELPDYGHTITLKHLATHTSGIRDQWDLLGMAGWRLDDVITTEQALKIIFRQRKLNFDPGEEFLYSNSGFTLLAEIVARVSGKSFAEFTMERIFNPLQMTNTLFYDDHEKIIPNRAYSYYPDSLGYRKAVLNYANVGATSLFTTAEDLVKWVENFKDPHVGNAELLQTMDTPVQLNNGIKMEAAMGQFVSEYKGVKRIAHGGADAGYRSLLARFPEQDIAVIVLSNYSDIGAGKLALSIADIYLEEHFKIEGGEEASIETIPTASKYLDNAPGTYKLQDGSQLEVYVQDESLYLRSRMSTPTLLIPKDSERFKLGTLNIDVAFPFKNTEISHIIIDDGKVARQGFKIPPFDPGSVQLSDFTGRYVSDELATYYDLIEENGKLIARHPKHSDITLTPDAFEEFRGSKWYLSQIRFERLSPKDPYTMKVSTGRVRDVEFTKE